MPFKSFTPEDLTQRQRHQYLLGTVNPRPICFASTVDLQGRPNLAPYSFFNIVSSSPPIFIFSVNTRHDGSAKDTLENVRQNGELVINLVNYAMARQMAICGVEYDPGVNEFEKGGLTPLPSVKVKPFRVKESPVQFECRVLEIKTYSNDPGASNLIVAQAVLIHLDEYILGDGETIDPHKLDVVGRLGSFNYTRVQGDSIFDIRQPHTEIAIGFDALPEHLRSSSILAGSQLALLAGVTHLPSLEEVENFGATAEIKSFLESWDKKSDTLHHKIGGYINKGETDKAWMLVMLVSGTNL